jgi:hypothetical protein
MDELNEGEQQEAEVKNGSQAERTTKPTSKKKLESSQPPHQKHSKTTQRPQAKKIEKNEPKNPPRKIKVSKKVMDARLEESERS